MGMNGAEGERTQWIVRPNVRPPRHSRFNRPVSGLTSGFLLP
jgi:hypothetical protein